jgi:hypothetical protein
MKGQFMHTDTTTGKLNSSHQVYGELSRIYWQEVEIKHFKHFEHVKVLLANAEYVVKVRCYVTICCKYYLNII